jgi:hypothetical protein
MTPSQVAALPADLLSAAASSATQAFIQLAAGGSGSAAQAANAGRLSTQVVSASTGAAPIMANPGAFSRVVWRGALKDEGRGVASLLSQISSFVMRQSAALLTPTPTNNKTELRSTALSQGTTNAISQTAGGGTPKRDPTSAATINTAAALSQTNPSADTRQRMASSATKAAVQSGNAAQATKTGGAATSYVTGSSVPRSPITTGTGR